MQSHQSHFTWTSMSPDMEGSLWPCVKQSIARMRSRTENRGFSTWRHLKWRGFGSQFGHSTHRPCLQQFGEPLLTTRKVGRRQRCSAWHSPKHVHGAALSLRCFRSWCTCFCARARGRQSGFLLPQADFSQHLGACRRALHATLHGRGAHVLHQIRITAVGVRIIF